MHGLTDGRLLELVAAYIAADYRWEVNGRWDLLKVGQPAPRIDAAFPQATRFGLLSAWDPHSEPREEHLNRAADDALHFQLASGPYPYRAAFSSATDRSWREPSWLVLGLPAEGLDLLARRFGQLGTLSWRRGEPVRLRIDARMPDAWARHDCARHDWVDWLENP